MGWKPVHEAHAIDRLRILVQFNSPLTDKLLTKLTAPIIENFQALGFEQLSRAESTIQSFMIPAQVGLIVPEASQNGWVLRRTSAGQITEEAGFRDGVFGYLSTEYGRWENLASRFWDVFAAPLTTAIESVDVNSIKLEYWDRFIFDGAQNDANASFLLSSVDPTIPADVVAGSSLWHSHSGWFEQSVEGLGLVLINRNIDVIDEGSPSGPRRVCNIFTLVELRPAAPVENLEKSKRALESLHRRSLELFGTSLSEEQRANIGLNLADYVQ